MVLRGLTSGHFKEVYAMVKEAHGMRGRTFDLGHSGAQTSLSIKVAMATYLWDLDVWEYATAQVC